MASVSQVRISLLPVENIDGKSWETRLHEHLFQPGHSTNVPGIMTVRTRLQTAVFATPEDGNQNPPLVIGGRMCE